MRGTLIVGAGPGGTGPLVWAAQQDRLRFWLDQGIAVLDRADSMGGTIGRYIINSDSLGATYLECIDAPLSGGFFAPLRDEAATAELERLRGGFPPLPVVGQYLGHLSACLEKALRLSAESEFLPNREVRSLRLREDGSVAADSIGPAGDTVVTEARTAILALGGRQILSDSLDLALLPSVMVSSIDRRKMVLSDTLFTASGFAQAVAVLAQTSRRRVVILGGRHSAFCAAALLTSRCPADFFAHGDIAILCRRAAPIFYPSREEAEADGCLVTEADICPTTRRVHRFSGMRGDGREMWRRVSQRPGAAPEERVRIVSLSEPASSPTALRELLDEAALVVPAFGYRSATIPIYDAAGRRLSLSADHDGPAVGRDARLLLTTGQALPNVFGIGLGTGYQPWGHMGGEANLEGQINSLWLYQNYIGEVVYRGVQECLEGTPHSVTAQFAATHSLTLAGPALARD